MSPPTAGDERAEFLAALLEGLRADPRRIPAKFLYDTRGSALFDQITALPEYYPTRTEEALTAAHADAIAAACGPGALLIELGSGSSVKTRLLLDRLPELAGYVPVDISREHLMATAAQLARDYPTIPILPVCADYTAALDIPAPPRPPARRVVYFPGSTIGNFRPPEAAAFLARIAALGGGEGALLIGFDRVKDAAIVHAAYDDDAGVTAAFNRNLLVRANRELGADFDPNCFAHEAVWRTAPEPGAPDPEDLAPPGRGRIEMWLRSRARQIVHVAGEAFPFAPGEGILTEYSYKYTPEAFTRLAAEAGWATRHAWSDARAWFGLLLLERAGKT